MLHEQYQWPRVPINVDFDAYTREKAEGQLRRAPKSIQEQVAVYHNDTEELLAYPTHLPQSEEALELMQNEGENVPVTAVQSGAL